LRARKIRKAVLNAALTVVCLLVAQPVWGKVLVRWTQPSIPAAKATGFAEIVVPWDSETLIRNAARQGYRVYLEIPAGKAADAPRGKGRSKIAGVILDPRDEQPSQVNDELRQLQSSYAGLPILLLDARAKQPQMKGQLVIKKDGVLQVTSPTAQPWIDSNLALVRLDRVFRPSQTPLYEFQWDTSDTTPLGQGPSAADYALAVAEAGALHADFVLNLDPSLQSKLSDKEPAAWAVLREIRRYLAFSGRSDKNPAEAEADVGVIVGADQKAIEPINLFARHNIPFAILKADGLKFQALKAIKLLVVFALPDNPLTEAISDFASQGGVVVVVGAPGKYPWQSSTPVPAGEHSVAYILGKGRVIELPGPVIDPETFAQDIRRLLDQDTDKLSIISLWNALTVIAIPYRVGSEKVVELVNYSQEPITVQVRIKGLFSSIRYETPERACCNSLTPENREGFTEFVIPDLRIAGRVRLSNKKAAGQ
jgi:hypothetical protein